MYCRILYVLVLFAYILTFPIALEKCCCMIKYCKCDFYCAVSENIDTPKDKGLDFLRVGGGSVRLKICKEMYEA